MKKNLIVFLVMLVPFLLHAQQDLVIKGTKPLTKQLTPQQVIDSIQKRFPDAKSVKYFKSDAATAQKGWAITTEDNLAADATVEYYTVSFKQEGLQYYGLYDQNGTLVEYKIEQKMDQLPDKVVTSLKALSKDHPGYKVVSKTHYMTKNHAKSKDYYEVTASNGKQKKQVFYSADGEFLKMK